MEKPKSELSDEACIVECQICSKWATRPRCLPCVHSFCETCLQSYIQKKAEEKTHLGSTDEEKLLTYYRCPVCNHKVNVADSEIPSSAWPKLLPLNRLLITVAEKLSLERAKFCDPCKRGDEEKEAVSWCRECGEALCDQCTTYHKRVKMLMDHAVFSLEEIRTQPRKIAETEEVCYLHPRKNVEAICHNHDKLCCMDCVAYDHSECKKVMPITDAAKEIKGSKAITNLIIKLKQIDNQAVSVIESRSANVEELQKQQETIIYEIQKLRAEIAKHLEELEEQFRQDFSIMHKALLEKLDIQSREFGYIHKAINNGQKVLNVSLSHGSSEHVYITAHKLKKIGEEHEKFIKTESKHIYHHDYRLKLSEVVEDLTTKIHSIAKINIDRMPTNTVPTFMKDMVATHLGDLNGKSPSDTFHPWFTDGIFLPNGSLVLADFKNKKIKCFDNQDVLVSELALDYQPWGVALFEPNVLVITMPDRPELRFITITDDNKMELRENALETIAGCHSIQVEDDKLTIACSTEVRVASKEGKVEKIIQIKDRGTRYAHRTSDGTFSYTNKSALVCIKDNAEVMHYSDKELRSPRGFAVDREGNFYICGMDSNNIHQVRPSGSLVKLLLHSKSGIRNPYAIDFEVSTNRFFVTQMDCEIVKMYRLITNW
ncbi:uncharacterized protein LOC133188809 [Saccostrea echinata]|uniref:uncharacterized protein LOC133188809 n=1 Tax=Saccostrea echinata TaxID=191078 RepID=UPI002A8361DB|nr:uncharacterized protein LOC133188809 [Saccostrea echinata]